MRCDDRDGCEHEIRPIHVGSRTLVTERDLDAFIAHEKSVSRKRRVA